MYKGFIKDVVNARDTTSLYIVEPPGDPHANVDGTPQTESGVGHPRTVEFPLF